MNGLQGNAASQIGCAHQSRRRLLGLLAAQPILSALAGSDGAAPAAAARPADRLLGRQDRRHVHRKNRLTSRRENVRDKRRRRRNRRTKPDGRASVHLRWIKFFVYNDRPVTTPNGSASIRGWASPSVPEEPWERLPLIPLANGAATGEFEFLEYTGGAIIIDDRYYVEADNSFLFTPPSFTFAYGGTMSADGYTGGTVIVDANFISESKQVEKTMDGRRFTIKRLKDIDDYVVFDIHFT